MKKQSCKFWKISCFILVFSLYTNVAFVFAQSADFWRAYNDTQQFYDLGYALGMEMLRGDSSGTNRENNRINFMIVNNTGSDIREIYISPSNNDSWGQNMWNSKEYLHSGYQTEFNSADDGPFDFLMKDVNNNEYVKKQVRITSNLAVNFSKDDRVQKGVINGVLNSLKNAWDSLSGSNAGTATNNSSKNTQTVVTFPDGFRGTWKRDNFNNTLTFDRNSFKPSNQDAIRTLQRVSGDFYTYTPSSLSGLTIKLVNGNLVISGDSGTGENNWNGTWKKIN